MAETVSLQEYRNAVTTALEEAGNCDAILMDLGRVLTQVTEDIVTPNKEGFAEPSFRDIASALLKPTALLVSAFPYSYTGAMHREILDRYALGARDYAFADTVKQQLTKRRFQAEPTGYSTYDPVDIHVEAFIEIVEESTEYAFDELMHSVIRDAAHATLIDKERLRSPESEVYQARPKVILGDDGEGSCWQVTDAEVKHHVAGEPHFLALTLENEKNGLTIEISDGGSGALQNVGVIPLPWDGQMAFRFRTADDENWSKYLDMDRLSLHTGVLRTGFAVGAAPLTPTFFDAIEKEIEWEIEKELEVDAHEH